MHFQNLFKHAGDEVDALLIGEPRDETDHEGVFVLGKPQFTLKRKLVLFFALHEIGGFEVERDGRILFGIVGLIIDAVQDAVEAVRTRTHKPVQTFSVEAGLDLLFIARRNGRNVVRIDQAALQEASVVVQLQLIRGEIIRRKAGAVHDRRNVVFALEAKVMDRHHGFDAVIE